VLLAGESDREAEGRALYRNEGKEGDGSSSRDEEGKTEDTSQPSKSSGETTRVDVSSSRPKGHRRSNKDRKSDRRAKGKDSELRRSAQELGVVYPDNCTDSDRGHYWIESERVHGGSLMRCRKCQKHIWLPTHHQDAGRLGSLIIHYGATEGYCRFLNHATRRPAKILIAKIQKLERMSKEIPDKAELARVAVKILDSKDFDRR